MSRDLLAPSASQTVGPFYSFALTVNDDLGCLWRPGIDGERIRVRLRVTDGDGAPVNDGMVEIWQADAKGHYPHPEDPCAGTVDEKFCGFGRLSTDEDGVAVFDTVRPGSVEGAAHINVSIFARGLLNHLSTRMYFEDDPGLDADPVLALVPAERRATLIARRDASDAAQWNLEIRLQGENETVFFSI